MYFSDPLGIFVVLCQAILLSEIVDNMFKLKTDSTLRVLKVFKLMIKPWQPFFRFLAMAAIQKAWQHVEIDPNLELCVQFLL